MLTVRDFVISKRGPAHLITVRVQLALCGMYTPLGRTSDAAELLEGVLDVCKKAYGEDGHLTLKVMDQLGESLWQQGRIIRAKHLHEKAVERMTETLPNGAEHEDTLRATDHLGRVMFRFEDFPAAKKLHMTSWKGSKRKQNLGPTHNDTLSAQENLAMAHLLMGGTADFDKAYELMADVVEKQKVKRGK